MSKSKDRDDYLETLYTIGTILLVVPIVALVPLLLYAILTGVNLGFDSGAGGAYALGSISLCGLVAMVYATIKSIFKKVKPD